MNNNCPICGRADTVARISAIYISGIELKYPQRVSKESEPAYKILQSHLPWRGLSKQDLIELSRRFSPPASKRKSTTRLIHPDWIVIALAIVSPIFLYGIYTNQTAFFIPVILLLLACLGLYIWKRRNLVNRYKVQLDEQRQSDQRVATAIERWMKLNYCLEDDIVFDPERCESIPPDRIDELLYS